jgi:SAM-dependent methyltransferase
MNAALYPVYFQAEKAHWWCVGRRNLVRRIFDFLSISKNAKILDIGCNSGVLVGELQKDGYSAAGLDMSAEAVAYGTATGIKNLQQGMLGEPIIENETFDVVMALDVLEHISDDTVAVKDLLSLVRKGGYIVCMVPAFPWLWSRQDEVAEHFRRYTKKTLIRLFENKDTEIVYCSYFNTILFLPIVVVRLVFGRWLSSSASDFELNNRFINRVFASVFTAEINRMPGGSYPFGISLCCIIKKT